MRCRCGIRPKPPPNTAIFHRIGRNANILVRNRILPSMDNDSINNCCVAHASCCTLQRMPAAAVRPPPHAGDEIDVEAHETPMKSSGMRAAPSVSATADHISPPIDPPPTPHHLSHRARRLSVCRVQGHHLFALFERIPVGDGRRHHCQHIWAASILVHNIDHRATFLHGTLPALQTPIRYTSGSGAISTKAAPSR